MMVCIGIQGKKNRLLRVGIYLFTIMEWVSAVGFGMFPLSDSGYAGTFQDKMHIFSTVIVVLSFSSKKIPTSKVGDELRLLLT